MTSVLRRTFVGSCAAGVAAAVLPGKGVLFTMTQQPHVIVVGAGAFGGWTALELLRRGARVTLLDAWGPGNSRASSGGETRVIRGTYGPRPIYTQLTARALALWKEHERRWRRSLYYPIGVLWLVGADDQYERAALPVLRGAGLAFEELAVAEVARRYPQIHLEGVRWAIHERDAGYLLARLACEAVLEAFLAEGGQYRQLAARPGSVAGGKLRAVTLSDGSTRSADTYVFACGPWLGRLFPDVIGQRVTPTRQEVFFFGTPAGDERFGEDVLPVWADHGGGGGGGARFMYGIPGNRWRGFKVADDSRGPVFDPTAGDRVATPEGLAVVRAYLAFRFPALKDAPLLEARVCQYEQSPDEHFIVDRHPSADNVWLVGGGSGHGFKHGPAVGELVAGAVLDRASPDPLFRLSRFAK
ncbi:MAG: FAD-dependent oxidoreductase [Gemmatimonadales bacterium]